MVLFLFFSIIGVLFCLILCAPYSYYPLLTALILAAILLLFIFKEKAKPQSKYWYIFNIIIIFVSYYICSFIIFKPVKSNFSYDMNLDRNKKAVIFYCEGEMEKYTPYYSNYFMKDSACYLKPFKALKVKKYYKKIGVNKKNEDLLHIASLVRDSLLRNYPYYFYIAFDGYIPNIKDSIFQALSDGCKSITIINYSQNNNLNKIIENDINMKIIENSQIKITITKPITSEETFCNGIVNRIISLPVKYDGILLIGENDNCNILIKELLSQYGYNDKQILISKDVDSSMAYFTNINCKNILYVDMMQSSSGIESEIIVPEKFLKYTDRFKISGLKSWGFNNEYVNAAIKVFVDAQN